MQRPSVKELKEKANKAGFKKGGFLGIGTGEAGVEEYLQDVKKKYIDNIMKSVEAWRTAGKSDKEILTEMLR